MTVRRQYVTIHRISDDLSANPDIARQIAREAWHRQVADLAGWEHFGGPPEITQSANVLYGCGVVDADGNPIFDVDGRPVIDQAKLVMRVAGWVEWAHGEPI